MQLMELQTKRFYGTRDEDIYAHIRIYYALYFMVSVNSLDGEYGDRQNYAHQLKSLLRMVSRRINLRKNSTDKAELADMAMFMAGCCNAVSNQDLQNKYWHLIAGLTDRFVADYDAERVESKDLFVFMRLIFVQWYGLVLEEGEELPESLVFAQQKVAEWMQALSEDGSWTNLSEEEALQRILLASRNSSVMLDRQYDAAIDKAYQHYCIGDLERLVANPEPHIAESEVRKYVIMYDVLQLSTLSAPPYTRYLEQIARLLEPHTASRNTAVRLHARSVVLENACCRITEQAQAELFID